MLETQGEARRRSNREKRSGLRGRKKVVQPRKKGKRRENEKEGEMKGEIKKKAGRGKEELNHFMGWIAGPLLLQIIVFHVLFLFGLFA